MNKDRRRTTIDLEGALFRKLKEYSYKSDKSIRVVITESLEEKFLREAGDIGNGAVAATHIFNNDYAEEVFERLEKITSRSVAETLIVEKCSIHGIPVKNLSPNTFSPGIIDDICKSLGYISNADTVNGLRNDLLTLSKDKRRPKGPHL